MRDLTWLSAVQGPSHAAAHARFVMAHQASRELRERARRQRLQANVQADEELQWTLEILFPQQYVRTTAR
jgi:hypothetical protein